jgi:hypothetical protein
MYFIEKVELQHIWPLGSATCWWSNLYVKGQKATGTCQSTTCMFPP